MSITARLGISKFKNNIIPQVLKRCNRNLSRRSSNSDSPFKIVKSRRNPRDEGSLVWRDPNFEILASSGEFPFFLPGNISPAWYDKKTTVQFDHKVVMEQIEDVDTSEGSIVCRVQECPAVLRQTVCDLFPNHNLELADISIITIMLKPNIKLLLSNKEIETEKLAQTFVLTANSICDKLRKASYWADFINPFSGRPYLFPSANGSMLYKTDEKFRCLDFQISQFQECKVITNDEENGNRKFIGSLFTNAPSSKGHLNNIFTK